MERLVKLVKLVARESGNRKKKVSKTITTFHKLVEGVLNAFVHT